jgi:hypothetical protein
VSCKRNFENRLIDLQQKWKLVGSLEGAMAWNSVLKLCLEGLYLHSSFPRFFWGLKLFAMIIWKKLVRMFAAEVMGKVTSCCCWRGDCVVVIVVQDAVDCTN